MQESTIATAFVARVYAGATLATLALRTDLKPQLARSPLMPGRSEARLVSYYGMIGEDGRMAQVDPVDLSDQYVRITIQTGTTEREIFLGICRSQTTHPSGTRVQLPANVPTGTVTHHCRGIESFLERIYPDTTITADSELNTLLPFNGPEGSKNRSDTLNTTASGTSYVFDWSTAADSWTAYDIIEYLLRFATAQTPYTWSLGGATVGLDYATPELDPAGKSLAQIVNELVTPSAGIAWRVVTDITAMTCELRIVSLCDIDIDDVDGTTVVEANTDTVAFTSTVETDRLISPPAITRVADSAYSAVEIRSEAIRIVATIKRAILTTDGFVPDWTTADETAFASVTDRDRRSEQYRDTYCAFRLPDDWDGNDYQGSNLIPSYNPATMAIDFTTPGTFIPRVMAFDRMLPIGATPEKHLTPLLLITNPAADTLQWVTPERPPDGYPPIGLELPEDGPRIRLKPSKPVSLAPATFTGTTDETPGMWDTSIMAATVAFPLQEDLRCRIACAGTEGVRRIRVPNYHLWVCPNIQALKGVGTDGTRDFIGTQYLRDDRPALKRLAAMASAWYGRVRNTLTLSSLRPPSRSLLGACISECSTAGQAAPIGTVVTSETHSWDTQGRYSYDLATDHADIDFTRVTRRSANAAAHHVDRRLARIEDRVRQIPVRTPHGGGADGIYWAEIGGVHTDNPGSGITRFTGSVFADPETGSVFATNQTIVIADYTGTDYPTERVMVRRYRTTWTGTSESHAEWVYAADVFTWWGDQA